MSIGNWAYLLLLLCVFFLAATATQFKSYTTEVLSFCLIVLISFAIGFRSIESGTDTWAYVNYFNNIEINSDEYEIGFELFTLILSKIGSSSLFLFSICAFTLSFLLIAARITKTNQLALLVTTLSFIHGFDLLTNGIRNGLGTSLTMLIIVATISFRGFGPVSFFAPLLGGLYHISSFIFPPFILIAWKLFDSKVALRCIYAVAFFLLIITGESEIDSILSIALLYSEGSGFINKAARYVLLDQEILSQNIKYYFFLVPAVFCLAIVRFYDLISNESIKLLARVSVFGFMLSSTFFFSAFSYRFFILFFIPQVMVVTHLFSSKQLPAKWKLFLVLFVFANFIITYSTNSFIKMNLLDF